MLENSVFLDITSKEPEHVEEPVVPEPVKEPEKPKEFPAICPQCLEADTLKIDESVYKHNTVRKGFWYKKYTFIPHYCRKCDHKYVEGHTEMEKSVSLVVLVLHITYIYGWQAWLPVFRLSSHS